MTVKKYFFLSLVFFAFTSFAQNLNPVLLCVLPTSVSESSGLVINSSTNFWTHNDSGDSARIYKVDTLGNLLTTFYLSNTQAIDIEEITSDSAHTFFYLEDAGNNLNDRTNLRIYKIPNPSGLLVDSIIPEVITFNYPDQLQFPPVASLQNFDCEALIHFNDSLYLFSKNRGTSQYCKLYRLPDMPGNYTATLVDSFYTGTWITSAALSPNKKNLILLSESLLNNSSIWIFKNYQGAHFFQGTALNLTMPYSQKEAIAFVNDSVVYLSDEKNIVNGGNLYTLNLSTYLVSANSFHETVIKCTVFPNPASGKISLELDLKQAAPVKIKLVDVRGDEKYSNSFSGKSGSNSKELNVTKLKNEIYLLQLTVGKQVISKKVLIQN